MAATRPVVLVFQEFATQSGTPATPELNCLVAGPAYWIQDFPADRAGTLLSEVYGVKNAPATGTSGAPVAGTDVIVLSDAPNNKIGAILDAQSVKVYVGGDAAGTDSARVEVGFGSDGTVTAGSPVLTSAASDFVALGVQPGDYAILTDSANHTLVRRVRSLTAGDAKSLELTDELPASGFTAGASTRFRIERNINETQIPSSYVHVVPGTNTIQVRGDVTIGGKKLVYGRVYVAYRSLRQDLADINTVSLTEVPSKLGRIDARNPLAVGAFVALQNTTSTIQAFGVQADTLAGYNAMRDAISSRKDVYAVVPLSSDINVIASLKNEFEQMADPDYALENGVPQKFRVVIGSVGSLPLTRVVVDRNTDGDVEVTSAATAPGNYTVSFADKVDLIDLEVRPGYRVSFDDGLTFYTVTHVNSATSLELAEDDLELGTLTDAEVRFTDLDGTDLLGEVILRTDVTISAGDALYLDLVDGNGTFVDDGVIPGDMLEMPVDPASTLFTETHKFEIATVVSNQRVRIKNNGRNTALVTNELPHGVSRSSPPVLVPETATLAYRVVRSLDRAGQVAELVSVAQSLKSRRTVICWPDLVDVDGLVEGATAAPSQPGYYLACAVGGMTAGLPSHQGFTNLGIAGIDKLYHANTYFTDPEITKISNGGWFLFQQDTPGSLPYCVHQLTTDTSTLEFSEFSMVKNFDFTAMFWADILDDFLGVWNVNKETIGFIRAAVDAGTDNLKLRRRIRIGAPIIDARIASLAEAIGDDSRLEVVLEVDYPKPLNTVALRIVSM